MLGGLVEAKLLKSKNSKEPNNRMYYPSFILIMTVILPEMFVNYTNTTQRIGVRCY